MSTDGLPTRIVVGANGAYWRDYGDREPPGYSMCPVSEDNDPVEVVAVYVRAAPTPDTREHPGVDHHWSDIVCLECGRPGTVRVSIVTLYPEASGEFPR